MEATRSEEGGGAVCATCLSERRTTALLRLAHVCNALLNEALVVESVRVCWECEGFLKRCLRFAYRARRAQATLVRVNEVHDLIKMSPLSTLRSYKKTHYDFTIVDYDATLGSETEHPVDNFTFNPGVDILDTPNDYETSLDKIDELDFDTENLVTFRTEFEKSSVPLPQVIPEIKNISSKPDGVNLKPIKPKAWLRIKSGGKIRKVPVFDENLTKDLRGTRTSVLPENIHTLDKSKGNVVKGEEKSSKRTKLVKKMARRKQEDVECKKKVKKSKSLKDLKAGMIKKKQSKKSTSIDKTSNIYFTTVSVSEEEMRASLEEERQRRQYAESRYKCEPCALGYYTERQLRDHRLCRHEPKPGHVPCPVCAVYVREDALEGHRLNHYTVFECRSCPVRERVAKLMWSHVRRAHRTPPNRFPCAHCDTVFTSATRRRYHVETRHKHPEPVKCEFCGKSYRGMPVLRTHIKNTHGERARVPCAVCGRTYLGEANMRAHARLAHRASPAARRPRCEPCSLTFKSRETYKMHLKTSRSHVAPEHMMHVCAVCGKGFAVKRSLREHHEARHMFKTNACQQCDKTYSSVRALRYHERRAHSGVERARDKVCEHCGKAFYSAKALRIHTVVHSDERPFVCAVCDASFRFYSALYKHNQIKHQQQQQQLQQQQQQQQQQLQQQQQRPTPECI